MTGQLSQVTRYRSRSVTIRVAWPKGQGQSRSVTIRVAWPKGQGQSLSGLPLT